MDTNQIIIVVIVVLIGFIIVFGAYFIINYFMTRKAKKKKKIYESRPIVEDDSIIKSFEEEKHDYVLLKKDGNEIKAETTINPFGIKMTQPNSNETNNTLQELNSNNKFFQ